MKLYLWKNNNSESDFYDGKNEEYGYHSGGDVVLAESADEAKQISGNKSDPIEIDVNKKGTVLHCDGEC